MDVWEGAFGWQGYAVEGRPDLLNYIYPGDVSWEQVWDLYRSQPVPPESISRVMGLFHASTSSEFDRAGCHLDPDGEICAALRAWACLAAEMEGESWIQEVLARQGDLGLVTDLYFKAAFAVYMEALLQRMAESWRQSLQPEAEENLTLADLPPPDERHLTFFYPEPARFPDLKGDRGWERSMLAFLVDRYHSWNCVFTRTYSSLEQSALLQEVGGEG